MVCILLVITLCELISAELIVRPRGLMLAFTNLGIIRMYIVQLEITILLDLAFIRVCSTTISIRATTTEFARLRAPCYLFDLTTD